MLKKIFLSEGSNQSEIWWDVNHVKNFLVLMDNKLELLNIVSDLKRAVRFIVRYPNSDCFWLNNILNNYLIYIKIDPNIEPYLNKKLLTNSTIPPLEKAEYLLMMANRLKYYLTK